MAKPRIACVVGTRPDAIKSAPVVLELQKFSDDCETVLVSTGQHREMLEQALDSFGLKADHDLEIMRHGQTLAEVTTRCLEGLDKLFCDIAPDYVVAQGDTTTTFCASLCSFYRRLPFGHVEAGLRTDSIDNPFPEEFNRRTTSLITAHHFAPTSWAAKNLVSENYEPGKIFVTGNTGIDAVLQIAAKSDELPFEDRPERIILLTTHRRENWGEPQRRIAEAVRTLLDKFSDTFLVVPMHKNPQVRDTIIRALGSHARVALIEPPDYSGFVQLMKRSHLILTDSGGVQEEAPAFGKPILVLRDTTERPEGVEVGTARLVGTETVKILSETTELLESKEAYDQMAKASSPYGDGHAAERIRHVVLQYLGIESPKVAMWK
jgi:UDP-N-acetylglucosamine 2-epimerase (non-hydrolysing)